MFLCRSASRCTIQATRRAGRLRRDFDDWTARAPVSWPPAAAAALRRAVEAGYISQTLLSIHHPQHQARTHQAYTHQVCRDAATACGVGRLRGWRHRPEAHLNCTHLLCRPPGSIRSRNCSSYGPCVNAVGAGALSGCGLWVGGAWVVAGGARVVAGGVGCGLLGGGAAAGARRASARGEGAGGGRCRCRHQSCVTITKMLSQELQGVVTFGAHTMGPPGLVHGGALATVAPWHVD